MKQLGALSAFGVDHVRSKQCMSQIVIADLCTPEGVSLLWQWLAQENVVARWSQMSKLFKLTCMKMPGMFLQTKKIVVERDAASDQLWRHGCRWWVYVWYFFGGFSSHHWIVACKIHTSNYVRWRAAWYCQTWESSRGESNWYGPFHGANSVGTLAEVQSGFLTGPIELDQVPPHIPLSKRFGIKQGAKTRCVDDFTRSGINSCAQVSESPKPHTIDIIASLGLSLMRHGPAGVSWKVRTYDLSGAYRQCAVHPDSLQFSYILVAGPGENRSVAFQSRALPFGSVRSVHAFLRVAHSLWAIATSKLLVPWTSYFDDFVTFSDSNEQVSVDGSARCWIWWQGTSFQWFCQCPWCFNRCIFDGWRKNSNWQYCI